MYICPHPGQRFSGQRVLARNTVAGDRVHHRLRRTGPAAQNDLLFGWMPTVPSVDTRWSARRWGLEQRVAPLGEPPSSIRSPRVEPGGSGLVSLNAHYHLRVPFSLDRVHLIARPVWVVVTRAERQVSDNRVTVLPTTGFSDPRGAAAEPAAGSGGRGASHGVATPARGAS